VAAICGRFGGGGHKNAAGCSIEGDLAQVQEKIETILNTSID
jgi:nanoRNase/pAp phosphatase (c-di-AMP/oligoRNAs hydrolase)